MAVNEIPGRLAHSLSDRYRIERELGAGGMATVYLAEDLKHGRLVAIKFVSDELAAIDGVTPAMMVKLGEAGVKSLDDLADLASDELIEIVGADALDGESANAVIMAARAHWFEGEAAAPAPQPSA